MNQKNWPQPIINSLQNWLKTARSQLEPVSDAATLEAHMLASFVLAKPRSWLMAHSDTKITTGELEVLNSHLQKLVDGYPFAYITGEREFYGRKFAIQPGILVPRPETELMVETALQWLAVHPSRRAVIDVGCGSGCIAISLAAECQWIKVCAVDIFPDAVRLTKRNAVTHHVNSNVLCLVGDLISAFNTKFDLICANLPYIPTGLLNGLAVTRFEPALALDGGENGLQIIDRLLNQAIQLISPGGLILLEIESLLGESAQQIALQYFPKSEVRLVRDLADHPRLIIIQS